MNPRTLALSLLLLGSGLATAQAATPAATAAASPEAVPAATPAAGDLPASEEMERARQELAAARDELQRASEQFARASTQLGQQSARAYAYRFISDENRAAIGIGIVDEEGKGAVRGVRVASVSPGSGADKAGIRSGDLLLRANGTDLGARDGDESSTRLLEIMEKLKPGAEVRLEYERDGKAGTATAIAQRAAETFGNLRWHDDEKDDVLSPLPPVPSLPPLPLLPPAATLPRVPTVPPIAAMFAGLGDIDFQLVSLDADLAPYFDTDRGVVVLRAPKDSALALKSGDVIQKIDGTVVAGPQDVLERLGEAGKPVRLEIVRRGKKQTVSGQVPERLATAWTMPAALPAPPAPPPAPN